MPRKMRPRRVRYCVFCRDHFEPDYKDVSVMQNYTSERGKILARRISGNCARHQRRLASEVKLARYLAFVAFVNENLK